MREIADTFQNVIGIITPPDPVATIANQPGVQGTQTIVTNLVTLALTVAGVVFLFMIIWGGFQWLTSGGDKESVKKAQGRLITAFIGIGVIMLAFVITHVVGDIFGFN